MPITDTLTRRPSVYLEDDKARARRDDVLNSHLAADRSTWTRKRVQNAVLELVMENPTVGSELNDRYRNEWRQRGWKPAQFESPRKRAEELAKEGFLTAFESSPETVYVMNLAGMARLAEVQS